MISKPKLCGIVWMVGFIPIAAPSYASQVPPLREFHALDAPSDSGGKIRLIWKSAGVETGKYEVWMAESSEGAYTKIAELPSGRHPKTQIKAPWWTWKKDKNRHFYEVGSTDQKRIEDGKTYYFKVAVLGKEGRSETEPRSAIAQPNYFNWGKLNNFVLMVLFGIVILGAIRYSRNRTDLFLRRIPGLDAVDEALGRATEMGRPILYLTGSDDMSSLSTIAATVILGEVAKRVAAYDTDLKVPHRDPIVMAICQEIVREAYLSAGRPDAYKEDSNFFITDNQFSYTAAVDGMMLRDQPSANFFMGYYYAEALLLAETGASTGAIQIAGTDSDAQLPFFITSCDYTLIGEELYAASAYLSREPILMGTLRGQDLGKAFFLVVLVIGSLFAALAPEAISLPLIEIFSDFR
jgi:hypothetical protein